MASAVAEKGRRGFAYSLTAGGSSSGALMLVDHDSVQDSSATNIHQQTSPMISPKRGILSENSPSNGDYRNVAKTQRGWAIAVVLIRAVVVDVDLRELVMAAPVAQSDTLKKLI